MGMSSHVKGFRPPDAKWKQMKAIYDSCTAAGIPVPSEVDDFFEGEAPDATGVEVELENLKGKAKCVTTWGDDSREGFEIEIAKLPKDVTVLRFYNSW